MPERWQEVTTGRSGLAAFADALGPARTQLVGGDGIPVEELLLEPVSHRAAA